MRRWFALLLLLPAGCHWDLNDPGTEPLAQQFYFPADIAADPNGRYLYVSNNNSDLRYGGGVVQLVDTHRFDCAVGRFCSVPANACSFPVDATCTAADLAQADVDLMFHPVRDDLFHFIDNEPECQLDPLDPSVVDCDETPFLVPNAMVQVGNFAGTIAVHSVPGDDANRRLFVAVRGDPSVTYIDVHLDKIPPTGSPMPGVLQCVDDLGSLLSADGYDRTHNVTTHAPRCDGAHVRQFYDCEGKPECVAPPEDQPGTLIPTEPFAMVLDDGFLPSTSLPSPAPGTPYSHLLVSHLATGQVSLWDASLTPPGVVDVSGSFFSADPSGRHGAFAMAPMTPHSPSTPWYMTSNVQPVVATFRVAEVGVIVPTPAFSFGGLFSQGFDTRAIAFEPGGARAFMTEANPPSVLVLDTRTLPDGIKPGQPLNQVVDIVDVCQAPSHMGVRRAAVPGATGAPSRVATSVYVVCFLSNQIMVVDPDLPGVESTIIMGRGPNNLAFNFTDYNVAPPAQATARRRAWVTQFAEMTLGELDLEPGSPTHNRLVARIGKPLPPPSP